MSRTGLFRAAALLAVGASPLLVGAASAAETPALDGVAPQLGADKVAPLLGGVSTGANPLEVVEAGKAVKLPAAPAVPQAPKVDVPAVPGLPAVPELPAAGLPGLPELPTDLEVPQVSGLLDDTGLPLTLPTLS